MTRDWRKKDPQAERESSRYANPIPSREFIIQTLDKAQGPLSREDLFAALGLKETTQQEALVTRLRAMERDGQLVFTRGGQYGIARRMDLVRGRISGHRDGFGFLIPVEGGDDLYLNNRQMRAVFDGDEVLARPQGMDPRGRHEAVIVEILKRLRTQFVGRYFDERGVCYVRPDNQRITQHLLIAPDQRHGALDGQMVVAEIIEWPNKEHLATAKIVEVLCEHMAPGLETEVAIRSFCLPNVFPDDTQREAAALADEVTEQDKQHRHDLRALPLVTIDGEDARDFDDAVHAAPRKGGGWTVTVAIADVSHYVQAGSALDREAENRGTSVYFPNLVVPMLPEKLSNGLCSLKPEVDRLCMVCEMQISAKGEIEAYRFFEGVMHSHARLTYNKVARMVEERGQADSELRNEYKKVVAHIDTLHDLYRVLRAARDRRGAIDFETVETRIIFGPDKKIDRIIPVERNDAHKMIEECMLAANICAAQLLEQEKIPALYRVHEGPPEHKLTALREYLGELGLDLGGGAEPRPKHYQKLLSQLTGRPDANLIQTMMLRSMSQAVYQEENLGHFGLDYPGYTHFTSPIRRYPDLLVHRAIRFVVRNHPKCKQVTRVSSAPKLAREKIYPYHAAEMQRFGEHCSMTERRADDATRDVAAWLKCEYLQDHVGDEFDGLISGVAGFGLFVQLKDIYVEGLVHVTALANDYYHFEPAKQRLIGERTHTSYHLGDSIRIRVVRVNLDERKIDLEIAGTVIGRDNRKRKPGKTSSTAKPKNGQSRSSKAKSVASGKKTNSDDAAPKKKRKRRR